MPYGQDDKTLTLVIEKYQKRIFALVLCLVGGDRDKAHDAASSGIADALRAAGAFERDDKLLIRLVRAAIGRSRQAQPAPAKDGYNLQDLPPEKRESLRIIGSACQGLEFDVKAALLLRDQLHMPYRDIYRVFNSTEKDARIKVTQARAMLRKKVEEILSRGGR